METITRVATVLSLLVLAGCNCAATSPEAALPKTVFIPDYSMIMYRGADEIWFSGQDVVLDGNGISFFVEGHPYPYLGTVTFSDEHLNTMYAEVPRYKEFITEGKTSNQAHQIVEGELKAVLLSAHNIFERHLELDDLDYEARRDRALDLTVDQRTNAIRVAADSITKGILIDSVDDRVIHHNEYQTEAFIQITGLGTEPVMFNTLEGPPQTSDAEIYTFEESCSLADGIEQKFASTTPKVLILQGGSRRSIAGPPAEEFIRDVKGR